MEENTLTLKGRLQGLAAFLPMFEDPEFSFGEWVFPKKEPSGIQQFPFFSYSDGAFNFIMATHKLATAKDFNQSRLEWLQSSEARQLVNYPETLNNATAEQIFKLLTSLVRREDFGEILDALFAKGLLTAILRRAAQLASEMEGEEL